MGMSVRDFFTASMGRWRSQRSSHNMAFQQFEQVLSEITITPLAVPAADAADEADVAAVCALYDVDAASAAAVVRMSWEGTSDWDEDETSAGTTVLVVVEDEPGAAAGRLLRSVGYTEAVPAVGRWTMEPGGAFVLVTPYETAAAVERIWFATRDVRMRVSEIRTGGGRGVLTASFSTEIRRLS